MAQGPDTAGLSEAVRLARRAWPLRAIAAAATAMALCALAWTALLWYRLHPHLPWQDLYVIWSDILPVVESGHVDRAAIETYLQPHYAAHRITVPRLLATLDILHFRGQGHALYAAGWAGLLALWWISWLAARRTAAGYALQTGFATALAGIFLLGPPGVWNLGNPINCSWHLCLALALAALLLVARGSNRSVLPWAGAYLLANLAALTNFAGVIALLLLPVAALLRGYGALALAAVASAVLVALHLHGISSDAAVALQWQHGGADAVAALQDAGRQALARNDLPAIARKSLLFLGWPLADTQPRTATVLVSASLVFVGACWIAWLAGVLRGRGAAAPGPLFYLLCASLCLGVAIATQLGRVIEQPNYAHGPSFERFQTVVSVYWIAVTGLALWHARALSRWPMALAWTACLAIGVLVAAPWGTYLRQEVESAEYAARLYMRGERPDWRAPLAGAGLRFKPEFVFSFDPVFERRQLAYRAPLPAPRGPRASADCEQTGLQITTGAAGSGGSLQLLAQWPRWQAMLVRDIVLYADGIPAGRMYPVHSGDYTPAALIRPRSHAWQGLVDARLGAGARLDVVAVSPRGARQLCRVSLAQLR